MNCLQIKSEKDLDMEDKKGKSKYQCMSINIDNLNSSRREYGDL